MKTERIINIVASLITIIQLILSIFVFDSFPHPNIVKQIALYSYSTRFIVFVILETAIAYTFSILFKRAFNFESIGYAIAIPLTFISAWVSILNSIMFVASSVNTNPNVNLFFGYLTGSAILSCLFININLKNYKPIGAHVSLIQVSAYLIILLVLGLAK